MEHKELIEKFTIPGRLKLIAGGVILLGLILTIVGQMISPLPSEHHHGDLAHDAHGYVQHDTTHTKGKSGIIKNEHIAYRLQPLHNGPFIDDRVKTPNIDYPFKPDGNQDKKPAVTTADEKENKGFGEFEGEHEFGEKHGGESIEHHAPDEHHESGLKRLWSNILLSNFYWLLLALAGTVFIAINYLANAGWASYLKRIPEAMSAYLPVAFIVSIIVFIFGMHDLYHWTHEDVVENDPILQGKTSYLNLTFFGIRMVVYFLVWIGMAALLRKYSLKEDELGGLRWWNRSKTASAIFMILFAITFSVASWDLLMTLNPHWFSTMYAVYTFASLFVGGVSVITIIAALLYKAGFLPGMNVHHFHDLGKFMFAFSIFWAYIWVGQYLLIWYANIPEETMYYDVRQQSRFEPIFYLNIIVGFLLPFLLLMSRHVKRNPNALIGVAVIILIGRYIDIFNLVIPDTVGPALATYGLIEIGTFLFFGGIYALMTAWALARAPIYPKNHPYLEESLHHEVPV